MISRPSERSVCILTKVVTKIGFSLLNNYSHIQVFLRIKENMSYQGPSVKSLKIMVHSKPQQVVIGHQDLENYVHVETCMKIFMICIT